MAAHIYGFMFLPHACYYDEGVVGGGDIIDADVLGSVEARNALRSASFFKFPSAGARCSKGQHMLGAQLRVGTDLNNTAGYAEEDISHRTGGGPHKYLYKCVI